MGSRLWVWVAAVLLCWGSAGWAAEPTDGPDDRELATVVVGQDRPDDLERKLGASACLLPSMSGERVSYLYNVQGSDGHYFLRFEVDGRVDAITVSKDPPIAGVCYAPVRRVLPVKTGKGLYLGATKEAVLQLYGRPAESFAVGPLERFRYVSVLDHLHEWDLVFRDGRLVEWTVVTEE
ncbi:MAG: hypothetical protein AB1411_09710 [Nitrospirota bacterium]